MMKKLLLSLFLFLSFIAAAQAQVPPLQICDENNDGIAVFDLASLIPTLLEGVSNPENETITFHETMDDSMTGTNPILTPNAYININPWMQTIYVRMFHDDGVSQDVSYVEVQLVVKALPAVNAATLTFCDPTELAIYDLNNAISQITGGSPGLMVTFHPTLADALNNTNAFATPTYIPMSNVDVVYARVLGPLTDCPAITTVTLLTNTCNTTCQPPSDITINNVTNTSFNLSWSGYAISTRVVILPLGSTMPPNPPTYIEVPGLQNNITVTGLTTNGCYSIFLMKFCDTTHQSVWSEPFDFCMSDCQNSGTCAELLVLNAFLDSNTNGIKDTGEVDFNYGNFAYQINDSGNNLFGNSNQGNYYVYNNDPSNSYDIHFALNPEMIGYFASATAYSNVTLADGSGTTYLHFPVTSIQPYVDASVWLYNQNNPRPGFDYVLTVSYRNNGLDTIANGTLTFTKDPNLTISSVSEAGIVNTPTGFTYDIANLAPNQYRSIQITYTIPTIPTVSLGQLVNNSVSIQINGDVNNNNNQASIHQNITGSYDPNDKSESHGGKIGLDNFTDDDYLYYTIRFENTGTASTEFIRVEDALNSQLDESSFEMIEASHPFNIQRNGSQLTWHFYNAQIPPTSIDPLNSHGFIHFKIKPKTGYAVGDIIPNAASIYFDYNPPIVTDVYNTEFFETLGTSSFNANAISMYPNPTSSLITITNTKSTEKISKVSIFDITGKRIYTLSDNLLNSITIDVSAFSKGMYLVELLSDTNSKVTKKLILK